ncbi:MAG: hypothetical protein ACRDK2_05720 [Solirubrobacteraceae bacterium]
MIMVDQAKRLKEPLRFGRRERIVLTALGVCVVLALAGLLVYGLSGSSVRKDCIGVTFASTLGGAQLKGCGAQARKICATGHEYRSIQPELRAACRRAGFPFD